MSFVPPPKHQSTQWASRDKIQQRQRPPKPKMQFIPIPNPITNPVVDLCSPD